jgi:hypothetical protein
MRTMIRCLAGVFVVSAIHLVFLDLKNPCLPSSPNNRATSGRLFRWVFSAAWTAVYPA